MPQPHVWWLKFMSQFQSLIYQPSPLSCPARHNQCDTLPLLTRRGWGLIYGERWEGQWMWCRLESYVFFVSRNLLTLLLECPSNLFGANRWCYCELHCRWPLSIQGLWTARDDNGGIIIISVLTTQERDERLSVSSPASLAIIIPISRVLEIWWQGEVYIQNVGLRILSRDHPIAEQQCDLISKDCLLNFTSYLLPGARAIQPSIVYAHSEHSERALLRSFHSGKE